MASEEAAETLAGVGEFAVIDRLVTGRDQPDTVALGPGDDAAVVVAGDGRTVVSTDMLVAGRHFRLDWSTPHDVGRKADRKSTRLNSSHSSPSRMPSSA